MANPLIDSDLLEHIDDETLMRAYTQASCGSDDPIDDALRDEIRHRGLAA